MKNFSPVPDVLSALDTWRTRSPQQNALTVYDVRGSLAQDALVVREAVTTSQLWDRVLATAAGLRQRGIGAGDIVAVQLPNWSEFLVLFLALHAIGAVTSPISPILRYRDVRRQLELGQTKALAVPARFGKFDYVAMARDLKKDLGLECVIAVGGGDSEGTTPFLDVLNEGSADSLGALRERIARGAFVSPADEMMLLNFTSGTSGSPKGVMHSMHSVGSCVIPTIERLQLLPADTLLVVPTLGHGSGILNGLYLPVILGARTIYMDAWDAPTALRVIARERVSYAPVMPTYVVDFAELPWPFEVDITSWRTGRISGGAIPRDVMHKIQARMPGLRLCPGWGMSETLWSTCGGPDDPLDKRNATDGRAVGDTRIEIRDPSLVRRVEPGEVGAIVMKSSSLALGYYRQPELTAAAFTADGWFNTGDLGSYDADGYLTLAGRTKDLVIRGGENVPVAEVETLIQQHGHVKAVVVVGVPDARLGEKVCAVVELRDPHRLLSLDDLVRHLKDKHLTTQFIPEHLLIVDELPRTPVGKIMKQVVKATATAAAANSQLQTRK